PPTPPSSASSRTLRALSFLHSPLRILIFFFNHTPPPRSLPSFPTRRSSDLFPIQAWRQQPLWPLLPPVIHIRGSAGQPVPWVAISEEHTSELQSLTNLVCRLLLEKKKTTHTSTRALNHRHDCHAAVVRNYQR